MKEYKTIVKKVLATQMNRLKYNELRGWELPKDENGSDDGMLIVEPDGESNTDKFKGYVRWLTKDQFYKTYTL